MELLPYRKITLETKLECKVVINRIEDSIENVGFQLFRYGIFSEVYEKPFEGDIYDEAFEIKRLVNYRNPYLPLIIGNIIRESNVTKIEIKIRPRIVASIFLNIFFIIGLIGTLSIFRHDNFKVQDFYLPFIFLLVSVLSYLNFWFESNKAIEELEKIIDNKNEC